MQLHSRQELAEFCLRSLGAPVINIEVDDSQLADALEQAISYFNDYNPDGIERDYVKHLVTYTKITVPVTNINVGDTLQVGSSVAAVTAVSISSGISTLTLSKINGATLFAKDNVLQYPNGTTTISSITLGDVDNGWIPIDEDIQGIIRILPWIPSFGDGLFDITYQLRMNDLRNLSSGTLNYFTSTMEYIATLDFQLRKEKQFRFNRRMNRLYLDINWQSDIQPNTYMIVECYRAVNPDIFPEMFNDQWLKKYATAWVKKYWGANLRKYSGVELPGGITLNGDKFYMEAIQEISQLEDVMMTGLAPLGFMVG